jgi:DHA2 family multidrug resistance protein
VTALQSQGASRSHSILGESLSLNNPALLNLPTNMPIDAPTTLAWLNLELTRQANMVSYLQVFSTMLLLTLGAMPFLLMIRTHTNTSTTVTEPAH